MALGLAIGWLVPDIEAIVKGTAGTRISTQKPGLTYR